MEKLADIKELLRHGDYQTIHEMSGVSMATINSMMQGVRNINTPSGAKVMKAAREIIKARQDLLTPKAPAKRPEQRTLPLLFKE